MTELAKGRTLVLGDTHLKWFISEDIIRREKPDSIVYLGDYFDAIGDCPQSSRVCAEWLKWSLRQPNRTHLFGNHDVSYAYPSEYTWCDGFTREKHCEVKRILTEADWSKLVFHHWVDGYLMTHGGFHHSWCGDYGSMTRSDFKAWFNAQSAGAWHALKQHQYHWYFVHGICRSGRAEVGGVLWHDFNKEFVPVKNLSQIVGHRPQFEGIDEDTGKMMPPYGECHGLEVQNSMNWCIDTGHLYYIIIEDGKVSVKKNENHDYWWKEWDRSFSSYKAELGKLQ